MTRQALNPMPRPRAVLLEQLRTVALALRVPFLVAGALVVAITIFIVIDVRKADGGLDFAPELSMVPGMAGLLLPIVVWIGEDRSGSGYMWTLPVDRMWHALSRVAAGWVCLMAAIAIFVIWQLAIALLTGGNVVGERSLSLLPSASLPDGGTLDPAELRTVAWTPRPVLWLVPFTAGTGTYLLASALAIGLRHPLRWIAGTLLGVLFISVALGEFESERLRFAPSRVASSVMLGAHGVDALMTARAEHLRTQVTLTTGETVSVWRGLPDVRRWAVTTLLWTSAGIVALWAGAARHRERRGGDYMKVDDATTTTGHQP